MEMYIGMYIIAKDTVFPSIFCYTLLTATPDVRTLSLERPHCYVPKSIAFLGQIEIRTLMAKISFPDGGLYYGGVILLELTCVN